MHLHNDSKPIFQALIEVVNKNPEIFDAVVMEKRGSNEYYFPTASSGRDINEFKALMNEQLKDSPNYVSLIEEYCSDWERMSLNKKAKISPKKKV